MIGYDGSRASDKWRAVLESGQPPAPVKPYRSIVEPRETVHLMHGFGDDGAG